MGLTHTICEIIHGISFEDLGEQCVDRTKEAIKDGVAVALAGSAEPPVRIMTEHMLALGGAPQASIWGSSLRASITQAAYINAVATHVLDFEPMWSPPTHSVSPTVPVAFALAQANRLDGKSIILAVAKGLEIQGRLQYAGDQFVPEAFVFHPPGVVGVIGSAITAATLLQLDQTRMQHALGLAASRAGSLLANVGSMTKSTHCGNAAAAGLDSALLAQRGFNANPDVLEAHKGLVKTFYPDGFDEQRLLAYGKPWRVVDPGLAIKLFPSQYGTHFAITAALDLYDAVGGRQDIIAVRILSPVMKYVDRPKPETGLDGKFSLQYVSAAALLDGEVKIGSFSDERRYREDMVAMLEKIELDQDASIPGDFHRMRVEVAVDFDDGTTQMTTCRAPRGSWGVEMDPAEHKAKLADCLDAKMSLSGATTLLRELDHLDVLCADDLQRLMGLIE